MFLFFHTTKENKINTIKAIECEKLLLLICYFLKVTAFLQEEEAQEQNQLIVEALKLLNKANKSALSELSYLIDLCKSYINMLSDDINMNFKYLLNENIKTLI
jgi:hypothetical protein